MSTLVHTMSWAQETGREEPSCSLLRPEHGPCHGGEGRVGGGGGGEWGRGRRWGVGGQEGALLQEAPGF